MAPEELTPAGTRARAASRAGLALRVLGAALALILSWPSLPRAGAPLPSDPTPDQLALLHRVRDNVGLDDDTLKKFAYTLERRTYRVNLLGKLSNGDVNTYEVVPSPFEPGRSWKRLVAVNGVRLSPEQLRREEARAREEAEARRRDREAETASARTRRLQREQQEERQEHERLADIERVFRFQALGEEAVDGRMLVTFAMTPRPGVQTRSDVGRHLGKLQGRIWIDPAQSQLVQAAFETTDDITVGLGVIGRIGSGSRMVYRRGRAGDGSWLPVEMRFEGSGRTLMLIPFHLETWAKYADFRQVAPLATRATPHSTPH